MLDTDQELQEPDPDVSVAVPLPPTLFAHITLETPLSSEAVPAIVRELADVVYTPVVVGEDTATVGE
jgi:hypothetical protein